MLEHLYHALSRPLGIVISVSDVTRVRAKLYAARKESGDPALDALTIRPSPFAPTRELFIINRSLAHAPKGDRAAP